MNNKDKELPVIILKDHDYLLLKEMALQYYNLGRPYPFYSSTAEIGRSWFFAIHSFLHTKGVEFDIKEIVNDYQSIDE